LLVTLGAVTGAAKPRAPQGGAASDERAKLPFHTMFRPLKGGRRSSNGIDPYTNTRRRIMLALRRWKTTEVASGGV
jgi:hypothetical protein